MQSRVKITRSKIKNPLAKRVSESDYQCFRTFSIANDQKLERLSQVEDGRNIIRACVMRYLDEISAWRTPDIDDIIFQGRRLGRLGLHEAINDMKAWLKEHPTEEAGGRIISILFDAYREYALANFASSASVDEAAATTIASDGA